MVHLIINGKTLSRELEGEAAIFDFTMTTGKDSGWYLGQNTDQGMLYLSYDKEGNNKGLTFLPFGSRVILFTPEIPRLDKIHIMSTDKIEINFGNYTQTAYMSIPGKVTKLNIVLFWLSGLIILIGISLIVWKILSGQKDAGSLFNDKDQTNNLYQNTS